MSQRCSAMGPKLRRRRDLASKHSGVCAELSRRVAPVPPVQESKRAASLRGQRSIRAPKAPAGMIDGAHYPISGSVPPHPAPYPGARTC